MHIRFAPWSFLLLALTLSACDSTETSTIGGTYSGDANDQFPATLTLTVPDTEDGESFSFAGSLTQDGDTDTFAGTGTYAHPEISLTVDGDTIEGTVSDDGETLTLDDDSGLETITLRRQ